MATVYVPLELIEDNPFQYREHYDAAEVDRLARKILRHGLDSVPKARLVNGDGEGLGCNASTQWAYRPAEPTDSDSFVGLTRVRLDEHSWTAQLAYGHRRRRAVERAWEISGADLVGAGGYPGLAGWPERTMPLELEPMDDEALFAKAVSENVDRVDPSAVELAAAMRTAADRFGWDQDRLADEFGLGDRTQVGHRLGLLDLPEWARDLNRRGGLSYSMARALAPAFRLDERQRAAVEAYPDEVDWQFRPSELPGIVGSASRAADLREWVRGYLAEVGRKAHGLEAEAERQWAEREPEMFDFSKPAPVLDDHEPAPAAGAQTAEGVPETAGPALDQDQAADGYDDGGRQLAAIAEADGRTPFDRAEEEGGAVEADAPDGRPEPHWAFAGPSDYYGDDSEAEAADWGALTHALAAALATTPDPVRTVFERYVVAPGGSFEEFEDSWAGWMACGIAEEIKLSAPGPREAAAELGVEVEWPDVSADTSGRDAVVEAVAPLLRQRRRLVQDAGLLKGKQKKEFLAEADGLTAQVDAALARFAAEAAAADVRDVCSRLGINVPAGIELDADLPSAVRNGRERKLYRAVRDAGAEGHVPRESDEKACARLVAAGVFVEHGLAVYLPEHAPAVSSSDTGDVGVDVGVTDVSSAADGAADTPASSAGPPGTAAAGAGVTAPDRPSDPGSPDGRLDRRRSNGDPKDAEGGPAQVEPTPDGPESSRERHEVHGADHERHGPDDDRQPLADDLVALRPAGYTSAFQVPVPSVERFEHMGHAFAVVPWYDQEGRPEAGFGAVHVATGLYVWGDPSDTPAKARSAAKRSCTKQGQDVLDRVAKERSIAPGPVPADDDPSDLGAETEPEQSRQPLATADDEPLTPEEGGMLVRMFELYEDTQAKGYRVLGPVGQATADALHERGLVCAHVERRRPSGDRVCLTRPGTDLAVKLAGRAPTEAASGEKPSAPDDLPHRIAAGDLSEVAGASNAELLYAQRLASDDVVVRACGREITRRVNPERGEAGDGARTEDAPEVAA